jgi:Tol biopolymer transport system component
MRNSLVALLALLAMVSPAVAGAAGIELISRIPPQVAPETASGAYPLSRTALSADGRYLVFASSAPNLVPGQVDPASGLDIFLYDRVAGTTLLISHASGAPATAGDRPSGHQPVISADGRFVAFVSAARDLVAGTGDVPPDPAGGNVFLWSRETGQLTLVSRRAGSDEGGDGASFSPSLSADGRVLVFTSKATDLVPGLTLAFPGEENVYAWDRATGALSLVSRSAASPTRSGNNSSFGPVVSADGRFVAYLSGASDLVAGENDLNGAAQDLFLYDRLTGATTLVSHVSGTALATPNGSSHSPALSADGRYVAFGSHGTNLVSGVADDNGRPDVFLYDRLSGALAWVSLSGPGAAEGGIEPEISKDGDTVVYLTNAPSPFAGGQIIAYDVPTGSRSLVTHAAESPSTPADRGATSFSISADGRLVAFASAATDLVAGQQDSFRDASDVFVHDRASGITVLASHAAGSPSRTGNQSSLQPVVSADGRWIAYHSFATDLVAGVRDSTSLDLFLHERATGENRLVTRHAPDLASSTAEGDSRAPSMSADGRYVAFTSDAALLPGLVVRPSSPNVYLHDRVTGQTVLVSRSTKAPFAGGDAPSLEPRISRDGSVVVFNSLAGDLAPGQEDRGGTSDVFLWDRRTGRITLVSHAHASRVRAGTGFSSVADVSADGNVVAFSSTAPALAARQQDVNQKTDVFLWDRRTGSTVLVSHHGLRPARTGNAESRFSSMSPDGAFVTFTSRASDLALPTPDTNRQYDAFLYERRTGRISLLSRAGGSLSGSFPLISANGRWAAFLGLKQRYSGRHAIVLLDRTSGGTVEVDLAGELDGLAPLLGLSDDGRWLLFSSDAPALVPGQDDDRFTDDLFLFDRVSRQVRLVSHAPGDPLRTSGRHAYNGRLSPDGRWVAFHADAPLVPDPASPQVVAAYLYDRTTEEVTLVSRSASDPSQPANGASLEPVVVNGGIVAFASQASDLAPRDFNSFFDVFVYDPDGGQE